MKKHLLSLLVLSAAVTGKAQITATFEDLPLPGTDTFYTNYSAAGEDVGFLDNHIYFPSFFDEYMGFWYQSSGFVYSNLTDTTTPGFTNQYAAITGKGQAGSAQYAVAFYSTFSDNFIGLQDSARGLTPAGTYLTNNTYAYLSMRDGDGVAKKFGGATGNDPDYFRIIFYGYLDGEKKADSVTFYLADFRFEDNSQDYIVKNWEWVDLSNLGAVDSITYILESSDTGEWGMNTPAYFCIDNFTMNAGPTGIAQAAPLPARVYPNPARDVVTIQTNTAASYRLTDMMGHAVSAGTLHAGTNKIVTTHLPAGNYVLLLHNGEEQKAIKICVEK